MTWSRLWLQDLRFQWRHGFYGAYVFVSLIYILLLRQLPLGWQELAGVTLIFSDPAGLGFFFIGGIFLLERGDGLHSALFTAPVTVQQYLLAKVASLAVLSVAAGGAVAVWGLQVPVQWPQLLLALVFGSVFFTLLGLGTAVACVSVNQYLLVAILFSPLYVPLLQIWGLLPDHWLWYLIPVRGVLVLIETAVRGGSTSWWAVSSSVVWLAVAAYWSFRRFQNYLVTMGGWSE